MSRRLWLALLVFFMAMYGLTVRGHYGSDQFMSYLTAESLVLDHSLAIGARPFNLPDIASNLDHAPLAADGRRYSLYGLALPLAMAPFYLAGHLAARAFPGGLHDYVTMFFVSATNAVVTALTCLLLAAYALRLGFRRQTAAALALIYGFGSMAWNYAQYSFAEPLFAALLLGALLALDAWEKRPEWKRALLLGALLGLCLLTEVYAALIAVPAIAGYFAWRLWQRRATARAGAASLAALVAGALPSAAAVWAWYLLRFGGHGVPRLAGQLSIWFAPVALYGFVFSSGKSFFLYVPPALLGLAGWRAFWRRGRARAGLLAAIAAASVLFISTYVDFWHGDSAWGPRFLFHLTFMAVLPLGHVLESPWRATLGGRWRVCGLLAASLVIQLGGVLVNLGRYLQMVAAERLGDPHFVPFLSPVVGHWLLIISTARQMLGGGPLVVGYPTGQLAQPWHAVNLGPYGGFDLWFVNLPLYWHCPLAPWLALAGCAALLMAAAVSGRVLWRGLRVEAPA